MTRYTYKVIPAPAKGRKASGVKGAEARFAHGLEEAINELAAQGWEYLRADILPSEERQGLTSTATVYRSVLVFRRAVQEAETAQPHPAFARAAPPLTARPPHDGTPPEVTGAEAAEAEQADASHGRPDESRPAPEDGEAAPAKDAADAEEHGDDTPRA